MHPQFTVFKITNVRPLTFSLLFKPLKSHILDYGYSLESEFQMDFDISYYEILLSQQTYLPVSILRYFQFSDPFLQFFPLACPSPTSLQSGQFVTQIFDNLIGIPQNSYVMKYGSALHEGVQNGLLDVGIRSAILEAYYDSDYFKNCKESDKMTDQLLSESVQKCQDIIAQIKQYDCEIINEMHINNPIIGLQGKIDVFGYSKEKNLKLIVELKTRSVSSFHKESHYKQVSMYAYNEIMFNQSENIYFDAIGIMEDSGSRIFSNQKFTATTKFLTKNSRENAFLSHCLDLILIQRQVYVLLISLLLQYLQNPKSQVEISSVIDRFLIQQKSKIMFNQYENAFQLLSSDLIIFKEIKYSFIQHLKQILGFDLYNLRKFQGLKMSNMKVQIQLGIRKFQYDTNQENGLYRLQELNVTGEIQRCGIFARVKDQCLYSSTELNQNCSYHFTPGTKNQHISLILFNFNIPRFFCLTTPKKYILITNTEVLIQNEFSLNLSSTITEIQQQQDRKKQPEYLTFSQYLNLQIEYQTSQIAIDTSLPDTDFLYCVLSRALVYIVGENPNKRINFCKNFIQFYTKGTEISNQNLAISLSD
ncbi:hypothetical protein SS50377_28179 [Spironucleus salmonicida]|uniref:PD-(D/E)XK endonuclease-like domain-containing protein n=1 Tax=Spironucleus salmonicida TaxID=348837 RepID=V6LNX7_9EUKA|nr:hypothetical protein SS50377_28179 [Spironucleus salmonicida]|eukprot:EST46377.1 hypothetical protein SS50377_13620 [Spironucleus salmonicida]